MHATSHRRRMLRRPLRAVVLSTIVGVFALIVPTQAGAVTPQDVCNYGTSAYGSAPGPDTYRVVDQHVLPFGGVVYLLWNGRYNCATTIKNRSVGVPTTTGAWIKNNRGSASQREEGMFRYYAGPVWVYGADIGGKSTCIQWGGGAKPDGVWLSWTSPFGHCS